MTSDVFWYRKKAVEIQALQFVYSLDGLRDLQNFIGDSLGKVSKMRHPEAKGEAEIGTFEDGTNLTVKHIATEGDFIIKGVEGEFYACKPQIFYKTYELI